jgi:hypothetical protein
MRFKSICTAALTAAAFLLLGTQGRADDGNNMFSARFSGFQEIGALTAPTGAIFSQGQGTLVLNIDRTNRLINFTLTYSNLSSNVQQSHIHFGKEHVAGAVMVFFCSNLTPLPTPTPQACPATGGTVTGTIAGINVIGSPNRT